MVVELECEHAVLLVVFLSQELLQGVCGGILLLDEGVVYSVFEEASNVAFSQPRFIAEFHLERLPLVSAEQYPLWVSLSVALSVEVVKGMLITGQLVADAVGKVSSLCCETRDVR